MHPRLSRVVFAAERNVLESRKITAAQRAFVEKLKREGSDAGVAHALLRAAQATQTMLEVHFDQLQRSTAVTQAARNARLKN
ncbi:MAG: hypothetical protein JO000_21305 [Alphaproteobacteria bacterium]|nr:hypothetical protein [Alphaproteobacteria bacterium]